jgi:hypothetical protein
MREVHHIHQPEDERQTDCDERIDQAHEEPACDHLDKGFC